MSNIFSIKERGSIPMTAQNFRTNIYSGVEKDTTMSLAINYFADALVTSFGPYGSHSGILSKASNDINPTKDGLEILSAFETTTELSGIVLSMMQSIAQSQNDENGDGSTTMILLFRELYNAFDELIKSNVLNASPSEFKKLIDDVINELIGLIAYNSNELNDSNIFDLIMTSTDGDFDMSIKLCEMYKQLDTTDPNIRIELGSKEHSFRTVDGVELESTLYYPSTFLVNTNKRPMKKAKLILCEGDFNMNMVDFIQICEDYNTMNIGRSLEDSENVIIVCGGVAPSFDTNVSNLIMTNPDMLKHIAITRYNRAYVDNSFLEDIKVLYSVPSIISNELFTRDIPEFNSYNEVATRFSKSCGILETAVISAHNSVFGSDQSDEKTERLINERIKYLDGKIAELKDDKTCPKNIMDAFKIRRSIMKKNTAVFYVGGATHERKNINLELIKDAVPQVKTAFEHGVVSGMNKTILSILRGVMSVYKGDTDKGIIIRTYFDAYSKLSLYILANKNISIVEDIFADIDRTCKTDDDAREFIFKVIGKYDNIRNSQDYRASGSANTDKIVMRNASDMASLIATSKLLLTRKPDAPIGDIISHTF